MKFKLLAKTLFRVQKFPTYPERVISSKIIYVSNILLFFIMSKIYNPFGEKKKRLQTNNITKYVTLYVI